MISLRWLMPAALFATVFAPAVAAAGAPDVQLQLSGTALVSSHDGIVRKPLADVMLHSGDAVQYTIVAVNRGNAPAVALTPVGPVQSRFAYVAGSAAGMGSTVQFSVDGHNFSAHPIVAVQTPNGIQRHVAAPAEFKAVRWVMTRPLAPHEKAAFSYEVRVR